MELIKKTEDTGVWVAFNVCPFCRFRGSLTSVDKCWTCGGALIHCPKCMMLHCADLHMVEYAINSPEYMVTVKV